MPPGHGKLERILVLWVKYQAIKLTKGIRTVNEFIVGVKVGVHRVLAFSNKCLSHGV